MRAQKVGKWMILISGLLVGWTAGTNSGAQTIEETNTSGGASASLPAPWEGPAPDARAVRPATVRLPGQLAEVVRLARAGMSDDVLVAYIRNSPGTYPNNSDQLLYLSDLGLSQRVLTALLEHRPAIWDPDNSYAKAMMVPQSYSPTDELAPDSEEDWDSETAEAPAIPSGPVVDNGAGDAGFFYGSLAPYGNWLSYPGYGWCWQPTVGALEGGWQPYCNNGNWVWSDYGWFWHSRYSWGWGPFHYGRWWHHPQQGWLWKPGRVWGPAWVTWRESKDFCGWAPLPPGSGFDRRAGWTFNGDPVTGHPGFGLPASAFSFVPVNHFTDANLASARLSRADAQQAFGASSVNQRGFAMGAAGHLVNGGINPQRVSAATAVPVQRVNLRDPQVAALLASPGGFVQARTAIPFMNERSRSHAFGGGGLNQPWRSRPSDRIPTGFSPVFSGNNVPRAGVNNNYNIFPGGFSYLPAPPTLRGPPTLPNPPRQPNGAPIPQQPAPVIPRIPGVSGGHGGGMGRR